MNETPSEIELLRAELAELRKEVAVMQTRAPVATSPSVTVERDTDASDTPEANRRGFLRLAGAAAVGATAAAVISQSQQAAATTGNPVLIGTSNASTAVNDTTLLYSPSGTTLDDQTFLVQNYSLGAITPPSTGPNPLRVAIAGTTSGADLSNGVRVGVYGRTSAPGTLGGMGVFGSSEGAENPFASGFSFGVVGTAGTDAGYGLFGYNPTGTSSVGVLGRADAGTGVIASSFTGISLYVRNSGRILQDLRPTAGAPTTGSFTKGEMIRDLDGAMYICTASGSPGTWKRVATTDSTPALTLLASPIRLLDSRGNGAPLTNGGNKFAIGTPVDLQITGTAVGGVSVPSGAKAILGNFTATAEGAAGFARLWPADQPTPTTSNINFVPNVDVANYFISAIDATGKLKVEASQSTHLIIDVSGYVI